MIQAVITDDEPLARSKLLQMLGEFGDIEVVGQAASATEAIELVKATQPALLFLDIRMPGMDGFEAVAALTDDGSLPLPHIIFTTAYDEYALKAFDMNAVDYLLKPYTRDRLQGAVDRTRQRIRNEQAEGTTTRQNMPKPPNRLIFKSRGRIVFLPVSEIYWIGAEENYVRICTKTETHLLRETMTKFEARLNPEQFLRIHRSTIVNLQFAKEIRTDSSTGDAVVTMTNGQRLPISRGYRARISRMILA